MLDLFPPGPGLSAAREWAHPGVGRADRRPESNSQWVIGPTQVGLVRKRFSWKRLEGGSPVALNGAAGYQARFADGWAAFQAVASVSPSHAIHSCKFLPDRSASVHLAGRRSVADPVPSQPSISLISASFQDVRAFMSNGGQKGVQRHRVAAGHGGGDPIRSASWSWLALNHVYGVPVADEYVSLLRRAGGGAHAPGIRARGRAIDGPSYSTENDHGRQADADMVGIVTTFEGLPSPKGRHGEPARRLRRHRPPGRKSGHQKQRSGGGYSQQQERYP